MRGTHSELRQAGMSLSVWHSEVRSHVLGTEEWQIGLDRMECFLVPCCTFSTKDVDFSLTQDRAREYIRSESLVLFTILVKY